jgi:hypothetical protein
MPQLVIVYRAYMELLVRDVDGAAERAARLAYDFGGYLEGSQSWYVDGRKATTVTLAVPTRNFQGLRQALLGLGTLMSENITGEPEDRRYGEPWDEFSHITLQLRPGGLNLPVFDPPGWDPMRTLQQALNVSLSILGFLADILIWVVVVAGPFMLLGWLGWKLARRVKLIR